MKAFIFALVFVFAIYFSEAKSVGAPVVVSKRDVASQAELLLKISQLLGKSGGVVAMLEKAGKPLLAEGIKKLEDVLKGLQTKVENAHPSTELGKLALKGLDELIILAEHKLEDEIKKIEGQTLSKRDVSSQAELLLKLTQLLGKSGGIVAMLEKEGKPLLAAGIKKIEDVLKDLQKKVENAQPHTELGKLALKGLDELIILAEHKLEDEIKKIEGQSHTLAKREVVTAELLLKLAEMLSKSKLAQELLEKEGKPLLAAGLKKVDEVLHSLDEKVRNADPHTEIGKLVLKGIDALIVKAEEMLEAELKKIQSTTSLRLAKREVVVTAELLLKLAEMLSKSKLAQELLEKEGKPLLAAGLKKIDEMLHSLDDKVRKANPHTEIGKLVLKGLDWLIVHAETLLEDELKKITATKTTGTFEEDVDVKDGLLKLAQTLRETAQKAIAFLKSQGKSLEATELQLLETVVADIEHRLETLHPLTPVGKMLLESLELLLKDAETKLSDLLKKLDAGSH